LEKLARSPALCCLFLPQIGIVSGPGLGDLHVSAGDKASQGTKLGKLGGGGTWWAGDPDSASCPASLHSQTPAVAGTDHRRAGNLTPPR
jgi:hypothetical protein